MHEISGTGRGGPDAAALVRPLSLLIGALGVVVYVVLSDPFDVLKGFAYYGHSIYDHYAAAILGGRLDVPVRVVSSEGHLAPDGTAYVYHGLLPVLPRLVALPVLGPALAGVETARWVILVSCALGAGLLHAAMLRMLAPAGASGGTGAGAAPPRPPLRPSSRPSPLPAPSPLSARARVAWAAMAGLMAWFASPGIMLVTSGTFYAEPVAMCFALASGFVWVLADCARGRRAIGRRIAVLSLLGALALHGRPTVAAGLLLAAALGWTLEALRTRRAPLAPAALGAALVAASAALVLWTNAERFGDWRTMHGSNDHREVEAVQHAVVFWGLRDVERMRVQFADHGSFNLARVPGHALIYLFALPRGVDRLTGLPVAETIDETYGRLVAPHGGPRRYGAPYGSAWQWAAWLPLAGLGAARAWRARGRAATQIWAGIVGTGLSAVLILSYVTVQARYKFDLWPLVAFLALLGLAALAGAAPAARRRAAVLSAGGLAVSLAFMAASAASNWSINREAPSLGRSVWSLEFCEERAAAKGFDAARTAEICALPDPFAG